MSTCSAVGSTSAHVWLSGPACGLPGPVAASYSALMAAGSAGTAGTYLHSYTYVIRVCAYVCSTNLLRRSGDEVPAVPAFGSDFAAGLVFVGAGTAAGTYR